MTRLVNHSTISTHALREEGDPLLLISTRAGTQISTHALREEGDSGLKGETGPRGISTHALREEGDIIRV